ncbi:MAG: hypothetical protein LUD46_00825 [Parabacteroides sp.]|nr:hypothetical protein [Parabacteroides sp.]
MKTVNKNTDKLTKKLLKEGLVEPSPELGMRIMDLIMQEAPLVVPEVKTVKMRSGLSPFVIFGILMAYLLLAVGLLLLIGRQPANMEHVFNGLKDKLPYILTIASIIGSLIFYSTLDKVLALRY